MGQRAENNTHASRSHAGTSRRGPVQRKTTAATLCQCLRTKCGWQADLPIWSPSCKRRREAAEGSCCCSRNRSIAVLFMMHNHVMDIRSAVSMKVIVTSTTQTQEDKEHK